MISKKKATKINDRNRLKIIRALGKLCSDCRYPELRAELSAAKDMVNRQDASSSSQMISYDAPILRNLQLMAQDLRQGYHVAEIRMEIVNELLSGRDNVDLEANNPLTTKRGLKLEARSEKELNKWYRKNLDKFALK